MNNGYGHIWIYIIILKKLLYQLAAEMPNIKPVEGCVCLQLSKQIEWEDLIGDGSQQLILKWANIVP